MLKFTHFEGLDNLLKQLFLLGPLSALASTDQQTTSESQTAVWLAVSAGPPVWLTPGRLTDAGFPSWALGPEEWGPCTAQLSEQISAIFCSLSERALFIYTLTQSPTVLLNDLAHCYIFLYHLDLLQVSLKLLNILVPDMGLVTPSHTTPKLWG